MAQVSQIISEICNDTPRGEGLEDIVTEPGAPIETQHIFKLFIAIDFGTDGVGLAYAWNNKIHIHSKWPSKRFGSKIKPKTIILIKKAHKSDSKAVSFGMDARHTYMDIGRDDHDYLLFERFKMSLYDAETDCRSPFESDIESDDDVNNAEEDSKEPTKALSDSSSNKLTTTFVEYLSSLRRIMKTDQDKENEKEVIIKTEGWLIKQSRFFKKWKKKYVRIENKYLCVYDDANCEKREDKIDLKRRELILFADDEEIEAQEFRLKKKENDDVMRFRCDDESGTQFWIQCIESVQNDDNDIDEKNDEIAPVEYKLDIKDELIAVNGEKCDSEFVFVAAFKYLQKSANEFITDKKRKWKVNPEEIQWIITVPAIWNDDAKNKMKQWLIKAGLVNQNIKNQCKIVYEPDCAALSIQYQIYEEKKKGKTHTLLLWLKDIKMDQYFDMFVNAGYTLDKLKDEYHQKMSMNDFQFIGSKYMDQVKIFNEWKKLDQNKIAQYKQRQLDENKMAKVEKFAIGEKYILVDAGGGTVDVACHEILGEFGVKEILHPSGGKWGSCYIDDEYIKMIKHIFGDDLVNSFQREEPSVYIELIHNFQTAKGDFYKNPNAKTHSCKFPPIFLRYLDDKLSIQNDDDDDGKYVFSIVAAADFNGEPNLFRLYEKGQQLTEKQAPTQQKHAEVLPQALMEEWNLSQYSEKLINDEGYDDFKYWADIDELELKAMGFKTGHAKKFMKLVQQTFEVKDDIDDDIDGDDNDNDGVEDEQYYLEMDIKIWISMFDYVVDPTIKHIKKLLKKPKLCENCKYLCLVGGLSCSPYFQSKMKQIFGKESQHKLDVIIPKRPNLAVVRGAAYFAITDNYIRSRILKRSYGVEVKRIRNVCEKVGISKYHILKNTEYEENKYWVRGCFQTLAKKNDEVSTGHIIKHKVCRINTKQLRIKLPILCSDKISPKIYSDGIVLGQIMIEFEEHSIDKMVIIEFNFYDTLLRVFAYRESEPDNKKELQLQYFSYQ